MEQENPIIHSVEVVVNSVEETPTKDPTENENLETPNPESKLISALKGSRTKIITTPRTVSFFINGAILPKLSDEDSSDDEAVRPTASKNQTGPNSGNLQLTSNAQSWYFQLCSNFTVEAACQSLNLQHQEILVGDMITKKYSTDLFSKPCFVYFDILTATVRWTKSESLKAVTRNHKYIKVGPMSSSIPLGIAKGTANDVELVGGESVILFLNNGKSLELKTTGSLLLDWYRLLRRFVTQR